MSSKPHKLGLVCFSAASLLAFYDATVAAAPLLLFVGVCMAAPLVPRLGFFLPIVSRGKSGEKGVSLTFDDGPDPFTTPLLLALLDRHGVKATFFVVGKKAAAHPRLIETILERGHQIGNHSFSHDNLMMLKSRRRLLREIRAAQDALAYFRIRPLAFRPPVGITNPKLSGVLQELGMVTVNFTCRGRDMGNRRLGGLSDRVLNCLKQGHIIALHDTMPKKSGELERWLHEIDRILMGIRDRNLKVLSLQELIGQPVMIPMEKA